MPQVNSEEIAQHELQRITVIGMFVDLFLGIGKMVVGWLGHSHALLVDGVHSLTDVASDVMVLALTRIGRQAPDADHPYGHGKFETLGSIILGAILIGIAVALAWETLTKIVSPELQSIPAWPVLIVATISIVAKEGIFRATLKVGQRHHSDLIIANAWHSRSDAFSSIAVLVGAGASMLGFAWADPLAALIVTVIIAHVGWELSSRSARELVETALPPETLEAIEENLSQIPGVTDAHDLRGRQVGHRWILDVHLQVNARLTVSEGHQIGVTAAAQIRKNFQQVADITVHIDPESDLQEGFHRRDNPDLPQRPELLVLIHQVLRSWPDVQLRHINLHYLQSKVEVELFLEGEPKHLEACCQALQASLTPYAWFGQLRLWQPLAGAICSLPHPVGSAQQP